MISYQDFKNEWTRPGHNRVDYDRVYAFQCVDLILEFMYENGHPTGIRGNAIDYATNPSPEFVNATVKVFDGSKQPGDILVFRGIKDPAGHIALRDTNLDQMLEQNAADGNGSGLGRDAIGVYRNIPYGRLVAVYRLKTLASKPAPVAPAAAPAGKKLFLPSRAGTWRVYNLAGPWTVGHEVAKLTPGSFPPGLTYDVLSTLASNVYHIHTQSFGDVAIYAGPDTVAEWVSAAPTPTPSQAPRPAPEPAAPAIQKPANIIYSELGTPLSLVVNKDPTHIWSLDFADDAHATAVTQLAQGTQFPAYGKGQRTDGDKPCYYMTKEDFGDADASGVPAKNIGVNTVDLSLPVAPILKVTDNSGMPENSANAPAEDSHVPVKVLPTDAWKASFKVNSAGEYTANADTVVHDLDGDGQPEQLIRGQTVHVAGMFTKGGVDYYRTKKKAEAGLWYGIPSVSLSEASLDADGDLFNLDLADELRHEMGKFTTKEKLIKAAGQAEAARFSLINFFTGLFHRNKK